MACTDSERKRDAHIHTHTHTPSETETETERRREKREAGRADKTFGSGGKTTAVQEVFFVHHSTQFLRS